MRGIIVEDEFLAREELKYFINNYSKINILAEFENGVDVIKFLQENEVDVIFLDINIPLLDGLVLAKNINRFSKKPYIVFITAYKNYALDAFSVDAFDYILKPYDETRIISMLKKLEISYNNCNNTSQKNNLKNNKINLWENDKIIIVDCNDICYCEANERITLIYTDSNKYSVNINISEFHKKLPNDIFFKSHRSFIVNITKIKEIIPWFNNTYNLKLKNIKDNVPVSRSHVKEFKQLMNI